MDFLAVYECIRQIIVETVTVRELTANFVLKRVKSMTALPGDTATA